MKSILDVIEKYNENNKDNEIIAFFLSDIAQIIENIYTLLE